MQCYHHHKRDAHKSSYKNDYESDYDEGYDGGYRKRNAEAGYGHHHKCDAQGSLNHNIFIFLQIIVILLITDYK